MVDRYNENRFNEIEKPDHKANDDIVNTELNGTPPIRPDQHDEEVASEIGAADIEARNNNDVQSQTSSVTGWIAIALSILSFFMMPIILGGAGIIVGFIARNRDNEWLGNTAIAAGAISILITLFVRPYVS